MSALRTAAKVLPRQLRRRCYEFVMGQLIEENPLDFVRNRKAHLELSLDMVVSHYRRLHPDVFFMQVGAFDGVSADPLYPLIEKHSLSGILIEPQLSFFSRLKSNYSRFEASRFQFVNAAIGPTDGTLPLYKIKSGARGPEWLHGLASFDKSVVMKHSSEVPDLETMIEVENVRCLTFSTLFENVQAKRIDLLQVDAEGFDATILRLFDIPTRRPAIIRFEHRHLSKEDYKDCLVLLINEGYRVATDGSDDTIAYAPEDKPHRRNATSSR